MEDLNINTSIAQLLLGFSLILI